MPDVERQTFTSEVLSRSDDYIALLAATAGWTVGFALVSIPAEIARLVATSHDGRAVIGALWLIGWIVVGTYLGVRFIRAYLRRGEPGGPVGPPDSPLTALYRAGGLARQIAMIAFAPAVALLLGWMVAVTYGMQFALAVVDTLVQDDQGLISTAAYGLVAFTWITWIVFGGAVAIVAIGTVYRRLFQG